MFFGIRDKMKLAVVAAALLLGGAATSAVFGQTPRDPDAEGKAIYKRANCVGCHKWHGNGGGGYGGDALSLRRTTLDREQIIQTVSCGRPGTGMPYHLRGAYDTIKCYNQTRDNLKDLMPPEGSTFLRPAEIELVADYVLHHIKGKGEPNYPDCIAFFGNGSRVCNIYREKAQSATAAGE